MTSNLLLKRAAAAALALAFACTAAFASDAAAVLQAARQATGGAAWDGVHTLHVHARLQSSDRSGMSDRYEDVRTGRFVREYSLPKEFVRMQGVGYPGSLLAKTLIIHQEPSPRTTVILVPETLGF